MFVFFLTFLDKEIEFFFSYILDGWSMTYAIKKIRK